MHHFDSFFGRWEIVDTVGLSESFLRLFGWTSRLPLSPLLHQWYLVLSIAISYSDEDGFALAHNEHVFFLEYIDAFFVETETVPLLAVLPTLIKEVEKSWNVSVCIA
jgi:hypothetical protein